MEIHKELFLLRKLQQQCFGPLLTMVKKKCVWAKTLKICQSCQRDLKTCTVSMECFLPLFVCVLFSLVLFVCFVCLFS